MELVYFLLLWHAKANISCWVSKNEESEVFSLLFYTRESWFERITGPPIEIRRSPRANDIALKSWVLKWERVRISSRDSAHHYFFPSILFFFHNFVPFLVIPEFFCPLNFTEQHCRETRNIWPKYHRTSRVLIPNTELTVLSEKNGGSLSLSKCGHESRNFRSIVSSIVVHFAPISLTTHSLGRIHSSFPLSPFI